MIFSSHGFLIATPTKCATTTLEVMAKRNMRRPQRKVNQFRIVDWEPGPRRQHRMALPTHEGWAGDPDMDFAGLDRYMMVRNPYARLVSLYDYLRAERNYSQWGAREICGDQWAAPKRLRRKVREGPPLTFEEFLLWLAHQRDVHRSPRSVRVRGPVSLGRAYRSPWLWSDSLLDSWGFLYGQGGYARNSGILQMERLPEVIDYLCDAYQINMSRKILHSNKNVMRPSGPPRDYWRSIECTRRLYTKGGDFRPEEVRITAGCECAACIVGVANEAYFFGYSAHEHVTVGGWFLGGSWGSLGSAP